MKNQKEKIRKIYFIGIGGIGVSALARYYLARGWRVFGSDLKSSETVGELKKLGIKIRIGNNGLGKISPDLAVFSPAVKSDNLELRQARSLGIKTMSYPEALGELTRQYKTIAVAGAHGKSTITAMIGLMMAAAKLDPTVIVGTKVKEFGNSNFRSGKSDYLVIEACEYDRSFLNYQPRIIVVSNIEMDHMECYTGQEDLVQTFEKFCRNLNSDGRLVYCADSPDAAKMAVGCGLGKLANSYSLAIAEADLLRRILKIPGEHNVANALAALTVGRILKIADKTIFSALAKYKGSWRRFDCREADFGGKKITAVFDYGHHPTQIAATMAAARQKWPKKKIVCVFQPHQAWRAHLLFDRFVEVFKNQPLDKVFITDIYQVAGRENREISQKTNSQKLVLAIGGDLAEYAPVKNLFSTLKKEIKTGDILLVLGAGDIYDIMLKKLTFRRS